MENLTGILKKEYAAYFSFRAEKMAKRKESELRRNKVVQPLLLSRNMLSFLNLRYFILLMVYLVSLLYFLT